MFPSPRPCDLCSARVLLPALALVLLGLLLRMASALHTPLWVDEAESSLNGLTILAEGYPADRYLGLPLYENTLTQPWEGDPEYEFRDSSYAARGMAVYHGWLPLYSIAAAQALAGLRPDEPQATPAVRHVGEWVKRSLVPRVPAGVFSVLFMAAVFVLAWDWAGRAAAFAALTWAALSERAVFFGFQARYYSAALALSALAALALWRTVKLGRWRDYVLAGVAEALLFHTHQVSALVFGLAAVGVLPWLIRQPSSGRKMAAAVGTALVLTVPWSWWSGFLVTAAAVPKVTGLFASARDWFMFVFERPASLALFGLGLLALLGARSTALNRWPALAQPLRQLRPGALFLVGWIAVAYVAVHLVVPAASFFPNRLSLMMQVPGIVLLGAVLGTLGQAMWARGPVVVSVGLTAVVLALSGKLAALPRLSWQAETFAPPVAEALARHTFAPDTRFYASPNDQLLYTYLTGLPVQSIAPIHRTFLESYPGPLVYIESHYVVSPDLRERVRAAAREAGFVAAAGEVAEWSDLVWRHHAAAQWSSRGQPPPELPPLPAFLHPVREHLRAAEATYVGQARRKMPIFRAVNVATAGDLWLSFSYRFVDYEQRLGANTNILPRLRDAEVEWVPAAPAVIFHCPRRPTVPDQAVLPADFPVRIAGS